MSGDGGDNVVQFARPASANSVPTPVEYAPLADTVNADLVALLKDYLGQAERGEITGACFAVIAVDGGFASAWSVEAGQDGTALGAIAMLERDYQDHIKEGAIE